MAQSWELLQPGATKWRCAECRKPVVDTTKSCPNCGARLFELRVGRAMRTPKIEDRDDDDR